MNCKGVILELSNYLDGELDPAVALELERHLSACEHCTMIFDQTKKSIEILCDAEPVSLAAEVQARLHQALRDKLGRTPS